MIHAEDRFLPGPEWAPAGESVLPAGGELLLVVASLDVDEARRAQHLASFTPREVHRYQSFAHDSLRFRWAAGRGTLREVLGRAVGLPPREIAFGYGAHGKPTLHHGQQPPGALLRFNLSHSGGSALIALLRGGEVGADIELPKGRRTDAIARRFYAEGENQRLFAIGDEAQRRDAFFRLWCCKEAFLKATGEGLSRSTRSYEIELAGGAARLLWARDLPDAAERFSVHPLEPGGPYRAAVVAEGQGLSLRRLRWP